MGPDHLRAPVLKAFDQCCMGSNGLHISSSPYRVWGLYLVLEWSSRYMGFYVIGSDSTSRPVLKKFCGSSLSQSRSINAAFPYLGLSSFRRRRVFTSCFCCPWHGCCGADRATSMASSWMGNPTDMDKLQLKHQLCTPFPVCGKQRRFNALATSILSSAVVETLSSSRVK